MKYMITSKEKPINHPINYVHTDLESFVFYSDSFNEIDSQLVVEDDILEIVENFREVLKKESQEQGNTIQRSEKGNGQQAEKIHQIEFQHLEEEEDGL